MSSVVTICFKPHERSPSFRWIDIQRESMYIAEKVLEVRLELFFLKEKKQRLKKDLKRLEMGMCHVQPQAFLRFLGV